MRTTSVARRYARATFEVARESGDPLKWQDVLEQLGAQTTDPVLLDLLRNPNLRSNDKVRTVLGAFPDIPIEIKNLLRILVIRHRIDMLPGIAAAFAEYVDEMLGHAEAEVTSARGLRADEVEAIQKHLNARTGKQIRLRTSVDPALIGGVVLRLGDEVFDASVSTRLERLRQRLV